MDFKSDVMVRLERIEFALSEFLKSVQREDIIEAAMNRGWHKQWAHCRACYSIERPHRAHGLCSRCYWRLYTRANKDRINGYRQKRRRPSIVQEWAAQFPEVKDYRD